MIIECTACQKKFSVPNAAITAEGRLVQCSSCGNKWTQFPVKTEKNVPRVTSITRNIPVKKTPKKRTGPLPYSKEYMKQKWGTSIQNYAKETGLSKKVKTLSSSYIYEIISLFAIRAPILKLKPCFLP